MSDKKRVYILVKTYPQISREYSELVCTAGILEDGSWIRLYPVPFRKLDLDQKYKKYSWIELEASRNTSDPRPETYRPNLDTIKVIKEPSKKADWDERKRIIFKNTRVYTSLSEIIDLAKKGQISLAIFKPTRIKNFKIVETDRQWPKDRLDILRAHSQQLNLFQTPEEIEREFRVVNKLPYKFSYVFEDSEGKESTLMIEDWELGMLYFNCLRYSNNNEEIALQKVKEKYYDDFLTKDIYFFLGTTKRNHYKSKNPFIIIGVFYPPKSTEQFDQLSLF